MPKILSHRNSPRFAVPVMVEPHQLERQVNRLRKTCQSDLTDPCARTVQETVFYCRVCGRHACAFHTIDHMATQAGPARCEEFMRSS